MAAISEGKSENFFARFKQKSFSVSFFLSRNIKFNDGNNYKKYRHPRQSDVVEGDRSLEWVSAELRAIGVVLIPIDTRRLRRYV